MTAFQDNLSPYISFAEHVDPSNPSAGNQRLFVDTDHILKMVDSSGTVTVFGTGLADPMTTRGDIIVRDASNVTARLAIGSSGKVLSSDGTDVSWATPAGGGAITYLAQTVLGAGAATIDISGISGAYKDLIVVCRARNASAGTTALGFRVGNSTIDTGANYGFYRTYNGSIGSGSSGGTAQSLIEIGSAPGSGSTAGLFGNWRIEILDYAQSAKSKTIISQGFGYGNDGTLGGNTNGSWQNVSAAIDIIRLYFGGGTNLDTGSALTLYGRG